MKTLSTPSAPSAYAGKHADAYPLFKKPLSTLPVPQAGVFGRANPYPIILSLAMSVIWLAPKQVGAVGKLESTPAEAAELQALERRAIAAAAILV